MQSLVVVAIYTLRLEGQMRQESLGLGSWSRLFLTLVDGPYSDSQT